MRSLLRFLLLSLPLVGAALAANPPTDLSVIPWRQANFSYFAQDQEVADVLRNFGTMQGVRVVVSPKVTGEISGRFDKLPPDEFLSKMARANGLNWLWDGSVLYISRADENETRIVQMEPSVYDRFSEVIEKVGFQASEISIRRLDEQGSTLLAGPPRFFQIADGILKGVDLPGTEMRVRVFPLQNAWANDLTFDYRETKVTVPGVASAVQNIMGGASRPMTNGPETIGNPARLETLRGKGLARESDPAFQGQPPPLPPAVPPTARPPAVALPTGSVHADVRLNAVVVRDTAERMPVYQELIRQLDVPVAIIEINAAIIDLNSNYGFELGTDFALTDTRGRNIYRAGLVSSGTLSNDFSSSVLPTSVQDLIGTGGFTGSALIVRSGVELLARVHALEGKGKARILSRPSVMTLDNTEAIIRDDQTFYVRVSGDTSSDLFNVSAGVLLKVTPHVVAKDGRPEIKMVVNIEDGTVTSQQVDNIPVVNKSSISTQAVVLESQSLLIGGLYHEQRAENQNGVPGIQRVPLLGALFRKKTNEKTKMERMFLITPRIINLAYNGSPEVSGLFDTPFADQNRAANPPRKLAPFVEKTRAPAPPPGRSGK